MFTCFRLTAVLLRLTYALAFCEDQEPKGYALPAEFLAQPCVASEPDPSPPPPPPGYAIQRCYFVADLVIPVADGNDRPVKTQEAQLLRLLTHTIDPESWSVNGGRGTIDYFPLGMTFVINQSEEVHQRIAKLLADLRKSQDVMIDVEVKFLHVPESWMKTTGIDFEAKQKPLQSAPSKLLDEGQVKKLLEAAQQNARSSVIQAPKLSLANGQESQVQSVEQQRFVTGVDVRWDGDKVVSMPHEESFETGWRMRLQPVIVPDQMCVRLHFNAKLTSLDADPRFAVVQTTCTPIEQDTPAQAHSIRTPKLTTVSVDRVLSIPEGRTALLSGWTRQVEVKNTCPQSRQIPYLNRLVKNLGTHKETECLLILVTPRIMESTLTQMPVMPRAEGDEETCEPVSKQQSKLEKLLDCSVNASKTAASRIMSLKWWIEPCGRDCSLVEADDYLAAFRVNSDGTRYYPRKGLSDWIRYWFGKEPPHVRFERIHGGIE